LTEQFPGLLREFEQADALVEIGLVRGLMLTD
jgi:hypothetical protein